MPEQALVWFPIVSVETFLTFMNNNIISYLWLLPALVRTFSAVPRCLQLHCTSYECTCIFCLFSDSDSEPEDNVRLWEDGWKERYYQNKFGVPSDDDEFVRSLAEQYTRGLCWVLGYYYQVYMLYVYHIADIFRRGKVLPISPAPLISETLIHNFSLVFTQDAVNFTILAQMNPVK